MKRIIISLACAFTFITGCYAQKENNWYARTSVGTTGFCKFLDGLSVSAEFGKKVKRMEFGGRLSYFANKLNDTSTRRIIIKDEAGHISASHETVNGHTLTHAMLCAHVGFDVLRSERHHLTPYLEAGYAIITDFEDIRTDTPNAMQAALTYNPGAEFEASIGIRYEYKIAKTLQLGAYYEYYPFMLEKDLIGMSIKKSF